MTGPGPAPSPGAAEHQRRILIAVVALAALLVVAASASLHGVVASAVVRMGSLIARYPVAGALAFTGLAALSAMLAFFSSAVVVPIGVQQWGAPLTGLFLWIGWLLGGAASYGIGRYIGGRVIRLLVRPARIAYYQEKISHLASFGMVLLFQSAVPSEVPGYVLGTARYPFPRYFAALALAELPYAIGGVFLGDGFLRRRYVLMVVLGLLGIGLFTWAAARLHRVMEGTFRDVP